MKDDLNICISFALIILLSFVSISVKSQNLIPNPSFEDGDCPLGFTRRPNDFQALSWLLADSGTPDYYHKCASKETKVPASWSGFRDPAEGDAYVGIYLKKGKYQENIGIKLTEPLKAGINYHCRFSIATVANVEYFPCEISFSFSHIPIQIDLTTSFDHRQVTIPFPTHDEFMDFSWHTLEFSYDANGGEQYMYLGSLSSDALMCEKNKYRVKQESMLENATYVYLDDFYLGENEFENKPISTFTFAEEVIPIYVLFDFDKDLLLASTISTLDSLKTFIDNSEYHLLITGATDSLGTDQYNQDLGLRRAESVRQYLIFGGIDQQRIGMKSIGESNPKYPNHSEETRGFNRSALIEFYKKEEIVGN